MKRNDTKLLVLLQQKINKCFHALLFSAKCCPLAVKCKRIYIDIHIYTTVNRVLRLVKMNIFLVIIYVTCNLGKIKSNNSKRRF